MPMCDWSSDVCSSDPVASQHLWLVIHLAGASRPHHPGERAGPNPSSRPHLSDVSLGLSNFIESHKLFISVPPSLGRGGRPLPNAVPQGCSQCGEAVVQPQGHLLGPLLSGLAGAVAAESPGQKEVPPHQYGRHTPDVPHGQHTAAPCHPEICGDTFKLWCWRRLLRVLGQQGDQTSKS